MTMFLWGLYVGVTFGAVAGGMLLWRVGLTGKERAAVERCSVDVEA